MMKGISNLLVEAMFLVMLCYATNPHSERRVKENMIPSRTLTNVSVVCGLAINARIQIQSLSPIQGNVQQNGGAAMSFAGFIQNCKAL